MTQPLSVAGRVDGQALLALWERGVGEVGPRRADAVLQAWTGNPAPPRTLGERNARLVELHARLFGRHVDLRSHCPSCGTAAQFSGDCVALAAAHPAAALPSSHRAEIQEYVVEFRLPGSTDLTEAPSGGTEDEFVRHLLARCVLACTRRGEPVRVDDVPEFVLDVVSRRMEALDPVARVTFALRCPQCGSAWEASLDMAELVWTRLQAAAEQLLVDVDSLARAYGWTEPEILALSSLRRAAYLQLVNA